MTNSTSWSTVVNTANTGKTMLAERNSTAVKKSAGSSKTALNVTAKSVVVPRRHSFDDNGGGYLGL